MGWECEWETVLKLEASVVSIYGFLFLEEKWEVLVESIWDYNLAILIRKESLAVSWRTLSHTRCWYKQAKDITLHSSNKKKKKEREFKIFFRYSACSYLCDNPISLSRQSPIVILDNSLHTFLVKVRLKKKIQITFPPLYNEKEGQEKTSRCFLFFVGHFKAEIQAPWSNHGFWRDCFYHLWWYGNIIWENVKFWEE